MRLYPPFSVYGERIVVFQGVGTPVAAPAPTLTVDRRLYARFEALRSLVTDFRSLGIPVASSYVPNLADLLAWPVRETIALVELEPSVTLSGFLAVDSPATTYQIPCPAFEPHPIYPGGVYRPVIGVRENATDLVGVSSVLAVGATQGSYFWDAAGDMLYVHSTTDASPDTFAAYQAFVRLHLATTGIVLNRTGEAAGGVYFWPWITGQSPATDDALSDDLFAVKSTAGGTLQATNGHEFWYRVFAPDGVWNWKNKSVRLLLGGRYRGLEVPYSGYLPLATMLVDDVACDDTLASWTLKPPVGILDQSLPVTPLFESAWPNIDPNVRGQYAPIGYGRTTMTPLLVDTSGSGTYLIADPAFQSLSAVHQVTAVASDGTRTGLTLTTDYTVDLAGCTITIVNPTYAPSATGIVVDVTGSPLVTFAGIVRDILQTFCGVRNADLDVASFMQAATDAPEELSVWLTSQRTINSILATSEAEQPSLERSVLGLVRQNSAGLWQVRIRSAVQSPGTSTVELATDDFAVFTPESTLASAFASTTVFFGQDTESGAWQTTQAFDDATRYLQETTDGGNPLYTFLIDAGDAQTLAQRYQLIAGGKRHSITFTERGALLYASLVGDVAAVSFAPAPTSSGMFEAETLELSEIRKTIAPIPQISGVFRSLHGLGNKGWAWAPDDAPDDWDDCSDTERSLYGFWADDSGLIDSGDGATANLKVWA